MALFVRPQENPADGAEGVGESVGVPALGNRGNGEVDGDVDGRISTDGELPEQQDGVACTLVIGSAVMAATSVAMVRVFI